MTAQRKAPHRSIVIAAAVVAVAVTAGGIAVYSVRQADQRALLKEKLAELAWLRKQKEIDALVAKPMEASVADARQRDSLARQEEFERAAALAAYARLDGCAYAIRDKMSYLEAVDRHGTEIPRPAGGWTIRLRVRLHDSFRAAPVGDVECDLNALGQVVAVTKVAR